MRSFFLIAAFCGLCFTACKHDQPATFSAEATPNSFVESINLTSSKSMTSTVKNTSSVSGTVTWNLNEIQTVTGWKYAIVIGNTLQSGTTGSFELAANASENITVSVMPNGLSGAGKAELSLRNGSNDLATISYESTAAVQAPKFNLSKTTDTGSGSAAALDVEYKSLITNTTSTDLNLKWRKKHDAATPLDWEISICQGLCYGHNIFTETFTIPANDSVGLKVGFKANRSRGTGTTTIYLFEPSDSAGTVQTFEVTHSAN